MCARSAKALELTAVAPLPWEARGHMAAPLATSQLYATEVRDLPQATLASLQTRYVNALWRSPNNSRCRETLLALIARAHTGDPWSHYHLQPVWAAHRALARGASWIPEPLGRQA